MGNEREWCKGWNFLKWDENESVDDSDEFGGDWLLEEPLLGFWSI